MTRSLRKTLFRDIRQSLGRFIAIFAITALGACFFAGLRATGPDMKRTADQYGKSSYGAHLQNVMQGKIRY